MNTPPNEPIDDTPDAILAYLHQVGSRLLTHDEEIALAKKIEAGDRDAFEEMYTANLRLVVDVAKHFVRRGLELADLIQEGNIGLLTAVQRYDWRRGCRFSTFATNWIKQAIRRALADKGRTVRLPVHVVDNLYRVRCARVAWAHEHGGVYPDNATLAPIVNLSVKRLNELDATVDTECISFAASLDDEGNPLTLESMIPADESTEPESMITHGKNRYLQDIIDEANLTDREYRVLDIRFGFTTGEGKTLDQVACRLRITEGRGVTRERIRQIESKALRKLREAARRLSHKITWEDIA